MVASTLDAIKKKRGNPRRDASQWNLLDGKFGMERKREQKEEEEKD